MGVEGLLEFIVNNPGTREKTTVSKLLQKVRSRTSKKPVLLCDYYAVVVWILSRADRVAIQERLLSAYSLLFGGDFRRYGMVMRKLLNIFRKIGVQPLFFIDSPPGSNEEQMRAMFYELKERHMAKLDQNHVVQQVCDGKKDLLQVSWRLREAVSIEVEMTLRAAQVPLVYCDGDADSSIVQYALLHEEVCGVLSTDTIFATVPKIQFLHLNFFDLTILFDFSLDAGDASVIDLGQTNIAEPNDPIDIACEVITAESLARVLGIAAAQLIDLSILCGNNYTRELNKYMSTCALLGLADARIETVANWLAQQRSSLSNNVVIKGICSQLPLYREAITLSYSLQASVSGTEFKQSLHNRIDFGPISVYISSSQTSVAYWRPVVIEATRLCHPCIGDLILSIRKVWYALLGLRRVIECGRIGNKTFAELVIALDQVNPGSLELLHFVQALAQKERFALLFSLLTTGHHFLDKSELPKMVLSNADSFGVGLKNPVSCQGVVLCTSLLVMADLNSKGQPSPSIKISEIEALIVTCLLCCAGVPPCHTMALPNMRAITIASWFTSILEHTYYTACLLYLSNDLPYLSQCFYSLAYIPFHMVTVNPSYTGCTSSLFGPNHCEIKRIFDHIINLPSVLTLRSFILNKGNQYGFQYILDVFSLAVREVHENRKILTPKEALTAAPPAELRYGDESEGFFQPCNDTLGIEPCASRPAFDQINPMELYSDAADGSHDVELYSDDEATTAGLEAQLESSEDLGTEDQPSVVEEQKTLEGVVVRSSERKKGEVFRLPVMDHKEAILELIHKYRVVCIQGETGCGKSSQVPQFILDAALSGKTATACKILVSQPRRVAAIRLAEHVATERHETLGRTVGFAVAGEKRKGPDTAILYCTTGYLLQVIIHDPLKIKEYTHIVLDEIHERSIDADFAMLVVRKLVADLPHVKVILMSATMQCNLIVQYFQETFGIAEVSQPYFVGMKLFPVETFFIDELESLVERKKEEGFWHISQQNSMDTLKLLLKKRSSECEELIFHCRPELTEYARDVCTEVLISQAILGESILVFLPGMADIVTYTEFLIDELKDRGLSDYFCLFMLHSQIPLKEQRSAFRSPATNKVHLILATNIAESSITIPNLSLVVNFAIYRQLEYNSKRHITCLSHRWCSHASCNQRAGRVGRVCAGTAVHLITKQFYNTVMPEHDLPAMATAPLSKLVLQAKQLGSRLGVPSATQLLSLTIEPPSLQQLEAALQDLSCMGAIASYPGMEVSEEAPITLLGHVSLSLPIDLPLTRVVFFGIAFGCVLDAVVLAAALSLDQDVFTLPSRVIITDEKKFFSSLRRSMECRERYDGAMYSDPIALCNMFKEFLDFKNNHPRKNKSRCHYVRQFSQNTAVRYDRLLHLESVVGDIAIRMMGHVEEGTVAHKNLSKLASHIFFYQTGNPDSMPQFCDDENLLKVLLVASFSHHMLFGVTECNSCFKPERERAIDLLSKMNELGLDYTRTLVLQNLLNVNQADLDIAVMHILPHSHCQTIVSKKTGYIQLNECFESNPKTELLRSSSDLHPLNDKHDDSGGGSKKTSLVVSHTLPFELRFLWQCGERHVVWKARSDSVGLPRPSHPCNVVWYRMNVEKERVISWSWRNMTGFLCELDPSETPFFAVPFCLHGFPHGTSMVARSLTILPSLKHSSCTAKILLAFQPLIATVDLLVDGAARRVIGARVNSCLVMFEQHHLTAADITKINLVRVLMSSIVSTVITDVLIPSQKAVIFSMILEDLISGTFNHFPELESLHPSTRAEPSDSLEPMWEVALNGKYSACNLLANAEHLPFELFPPLSCSLVKPNVLEEAFKRMQIGPSMCSKNLSACGRSSPVVVPTQDHVLSFRLSPHAPSFKPHTRLSSPIALLPKPVGSDVVSNPTRCLHFSLPEASGPSPVCYTPQTILHSSPISCLSVPLPSSSTLSRSSTLSHSVPSKSSHSGPRPFFPRLSEQPLMHADFWSQQSTPTSQQTTGTLSALSPSHHSSTHPGVMQVASKQLNTPVHPLPISSSTTTPPTVLPPPNVSIVLPPPPPLGLAGFRSLLDCVSHVAAHKTILPRYLQDKKSSSLPSSPVWYGHEKLVSPDNDGSQKSSVLLGSGNVSVNKPVKPDEQQLVEFMIEYIGSQGGCVNFNQLVKDAYPDFKQKNNIIGDDFSLTWHFFVCHPKVFALYGHPGYCLVQLLKPFGSKTNVDPTQRCVVSPIVDQGAPKTNRDAGELAMQPVRIEDLDSVMQISPYQLVSTRQDNVEPVQRVKEAEGVRATEGTVDKGCHQQEVVLEDLNNDSRIVKDSDTESTNHSSFSKKYAVTEETTCIYGDMVDTRVLADCAEKDLHCGVEELTTNATDIMQLSQGPDSERVEPATISDHLLLQAAAEVKNISSVTAVEEAINEDGDHHESVGGAAAQHILQCDIMYPAKAAGDSSLSSTGLDSNCSAAAVDDGPALLSLLSPDLYELQLLLRSLSVENNTTQAETGSPTPSALEVVAVGDKCELGVDKPGEENSLLPDFTSILLEQWKWPQADTEQYELSGCAGSLLDNCSVVATPSSSLCNLSFLGASSNKDWTEFSTPILTGDICSTQVHDSYFSSPLFQEPFSSPLFQEPFRSGVDAQDEVPLIDGNLDFEDLSPLTTTAPTISTSSPDIFGGQEAIGNKEAESQDPIIAADPTCTSSCEGCGSCHNILLQGAKCGDPITTASSDFPLCEGDDVLCCNSHEGKYISGSSTQLTGHGCEEESPFDSGIPSSGCDPEGDFAGYSYCHEGESLSDSGVPPTGCEWESPDIAPPCHSHEIESLGIVLPVFYLQGKGHLDSNIQPYSHGRGEESPSAESSWTLNPEALTLKLEDKIEQAFSTLTSICENLDLTGVPSQDRSSQLTTSGNYAAAPTELKVEKSSDDPVNSHPSSEGAMPLCASEALTSDATFVPYHLLSRHRRLQPGSILHLISYFVDYFTFCGGGDYFANLVLVFREKYLPMCRNCVIKRLTVDLFRQFPEDFVVIGRPRGRFIILRDVYQVGCTKDTKSLDFVCEQSEKCKFVTRICQLLLEQKKGLHFDELKKKSVLSRKMKHLNMPEFFKDMKWFFAVDVEENPLITLKTRVCNVYEEFLPFFAKNFQMKQLACKLCQNKTDGLLPTPDVSSLQCNLDLPKAKARNIQSVKAAVSAEPMKGKNEAGAKVAPALPKRVRFKVSTAKALHKTK